MIDRETIDKILDATNIVDVVSEFVTLKKSGVNNRLKKLLSLAGVK